MKNLTIPSLALAAALVLPTTAAGQEAQLPLAPPTVKPAAGKVAIKARGGISAKKTRYVAKGGSVRVIGTVRPFVAGQTATVKIFRKGKVVKQAQVPIRKGKRGAGKVAYRFKMSRRGRARVRIGHAATPQQAAFRSRDVKLRAVVMQNGEGASGLDVLLLQRGLRQLGFAVPVDGGYGPATSRAVTAFRKTNDMPRQGYASKRVYSMVLRGRGAFKARYPGSGRHVEFDWSRQVLAIFDGAKPRNVYHSSSGAPSTPTVFGTFRFYRKEPGTNSLGMVHSNYFIGGYAIHGYHSVPNYPASHGCLRVPIPNALEIDRQIEIGQPIHVYR